MFTKKYCIFTAYTAKVCAKFTISQKISIESSWMYGIMIFGGRYVKAQSLYHIQQARVDF